MIDFRWGGPLGITGCRWPWYSSNCMFISEFPLAICLPIHRLSARLLHSRANGAVSFPSSHDGTSNPSCLMLLRSCIPWLLLVVFYGMEGLWVLLVHRWHQCFMQKHPNPLARQVSQCHSSHRATSLKRKRAIVGKSCYPRVWHHIPNTGTLFQVLSWQEITVWIKEEIQGSSQCIIGKGVTSPGIMVIPSPWSLRIENLTYIYLEHTAYVNNGNSA